MKIQRKLGQFLSTAALASLIASTTYVPAFNAHGRLLIGGQTYHVVYSKQKWEVHQTQ